MIAAVETENEQNAPCNEGSRGWFKRPFACSAKVFRQQRRQQRHKSEHTSANLGGQNVLLCGEIWTSESGGEQGIWA